MINLNLTDLFLFGGASQGIILALALFRSCHQNKKANIILAVTLLMASLMLFGRLFYIRYPADWVYQWSLLPDVFIFLFGPFSYLYAKRLIIDDSRSLNSFDFALPGIFVLVATYLISLPLNEFLALLMAGKLYFTYAIMEGAAIISNFIYWTKSYQLYRAYQQEGRKQLSYSPVIFKFTRVLLLTILTSLIAWIYAYITHYYKLGNPIINYDIVWIVIPLSIYIVGYISLRENHVFKILKTVPERSQTLGEDDILQIEKSIKKLVGEGEFYLDRQLTLVDLSKLINVSTNKLSWYLNKVHGCNFYDFVNQLRVQAFIQRLEDGDHVQQTLLSIAMEVGFNSKSTFNKAFKMFTNETPSAYVKRHSVPANLKVGANL